ncbi:hypothetical protein Sjap_010671 [Stephania japonica]|uniref:SCP domain-containing protein n=1 Tax=Stephania japonica TaxID=461633 RepID=A0AAP0J9T4_9MAGN
MFTAHTTLSICLLSLLCINIATNAAQISGYLPLETQFLAPQNAARAVRGMKPLVWDSRVAKYAQGYANRRRRDCELTHSNGPYGENIFWGSGKDWSAAEAATAWVSEKRFYKYWSNSCAWGKMCGHYTQIVWRGSKRVGCARAVCDGGKGVFMTCNYDPPGNYVGERPY